jgi:predicted DNA-binding transcriptional regulator AlpA
MLIVNALPIQQHRYGDDMPSTDSPSAVRSSEFATTPIDTVNVTDISIRKPPQRATAMPYSLTGDPLLTVDDVASRLNVSMDWVWDHSSRKTPRLPVIRMGDGTLRYRASGIEDFISERERLSSLRDKHR